jgi:hypothetical protein
MDVPSLGVNSSLTISESLLWILLQQVQNRKKDNMSQHGRVNVSLVENEAAPVSVAIVKNE